MTAIPGSLSGLRETQTFITTHDLQTKKAKVHSARPEQWRSYDEGKIGFNLIYTTYQTPPSLQDEKDIKAHDKVVADYKLGLTVPGGSVLRMVDFAPGYECMMHRTESLDFGIIIEGEVYMKLDSGESRLLKRGDVAVQRATMHSWKNPSETEWARIMFVLQRCDPVEVGGELLMEDFGTELKGLPRSE